MSRFLLLCPIFILYSTILPVQSNGYHPSGQLSDHEYFIRISGIHTRQDVETIQNIIGKKEGVTFFMANRYPVRYFVMRSSRPISVKEFETFLNDRSLYIEFYGEGEKGREQAVLLYNKTKAR